MNHTHHCHQTQIDCGERASTIKNTSSAQILALNTDVAERQILGDGAALQSLPYSGKFEAQTVAHPFGSVRSRTRVGETEVGGSEWDDGRFGVFFEQRYSTERRDRQRLT